MKKYALTGIIASFLLFCNYVSADDSAFQLGSPFTENMVLQRDMPIKVWGWGQPGKEINIHIADKQTKGVVGKEGRWSVELPKLMAGGPHTFIAGSGDEKITFKNVLVGDVWLCAGQSNMGKGHRGMPDIIELAEKSKKLPIRYMLVPRKVGLTPWDKTSAKWVEDAPASAVACAFAYDLQQATKIPIGIIEASWGSAFIEGFMPLDMQDELPHFKRMMKNFAKNDKQRVAKAVDDDKKGLIWAKRVDIFVRQRPNILYNAMIHPIAPYTMRGMVWYQGEANARSVGMMQQYAKSLSKWCLRLRKQWNQKDFHLIAVMLPGYGKNFPEKNREATAKLPYAPSWAWMRESQISLLKLPNTSVVNTIDLGALDNIHPLDKRPIGKRLTLLVERDVLGREILAEGPKMKEVVIQGKSIRISYNYGEGLHTNNKLPPSGFWVAGKDRNWHVASAVIDKEEIVLTCENVPAPEVLRYAFAGMPDVNLVNSANLPALPFRTDTDSPYSVAKRNKH
jgi:sialate O-acetylesterase